MIYLIVALIAVAVVWLGWKATSRTGYESATYTVIETDGDFEVREYPDLMLVTTSSRLQSQGNDGSFQRLFKYISGGNDSKSKVAMTTPVFMESEMGDSDGQMGFVLPADVANGTIPSPTDGNVEVEKRTAGKFAVLRFAGRVDDSTRATMQGKLEKWMESRQLVGVGTIEFAGYDPPWTPGPLRRNEVLIRLQ